MELSMKTKIGDLLDAYPFLLEYLLKQSPKFSKLENPFLRKTVAAFASVSKAASLGGLDPDDFLAGIAAEIFKKSNDSVTLVNSGGRTEHARGASREERVETFKKIVMRLHGGESLDSLRQEFHALLKDVSPAEVGAMEQRLVAEGIPESEIKKLCNLHVELFTADADKPELPPLPEGHPIRTFQVENALAEEKASNLSTILGGVRDALGYSGARNALKNGVADLAAIVRHYERKENQLFPIMEAHGLTAPPQVMWEIHDDIRAMFKKAQSCLESPEHAPAVSAVSELVLAVRDMVFKEERILFPMVHETFSEEDWRKVRKGEAEIGFAWVDPGDAWLPAGEAAPGGSGTGGRVRLDCGLLEPEVINAILKHLPVDMTFVGPDDRVAYFSQTEERIFPRSEGIVGREVSKCHPPKSVHMVEDILTRFKSGERDTAEFWIELGGRFIHIRYFAVRRDGQYLGCLEVSQDVTGIRALTGQKRLLDWN
jgi:DUF438 domain-containing protein